MTEIYDNAHQGNISTRQSYCKLKQPLRKSNAGQNTLSYLGPGQWNKLPNTIKEMVNINTFKHKVKQHLFSQMEIKNSLGY